MKRYAAALMLCLFASLAVAAHATDSPIGTVFYQRYATMKAAMHAHDGAAVAAMLAPGFTSVDVDGKSEDGPAMIQEVNALQADPNKTSTTTIISIEPSGTTTIVKQKYDMKTIKTGPDGSKRNIELVTLSTDTWVTLDGKLLLQRTETDQMDYYVNGTLAAHRVRP
jgi:hypothetical protein